MSHFDFCFYPFIIYTRIARTTLYFLVQLRYWAPVPIEYQVYLENQSFSLTLLRKETEKNSCRRGNLSVISCLEVVSQFILYSHSLCRLSAYKLKKLFDSRQQRSFAEISLKISTFFSRQSAPVISLARKLVN